MAVAGSVRRRERDDIGIVNLPRSSGILLHVTSLPGGRLGPAAYGFVDWLAAAGQSWWQVLPLGPPDRSGSPYTSTSAFAAWPGLLADPEAPVSAARARGVPRRARVLDRRLGALRRRRARSADQVRFEREWSALRRYASARGVRLIGDIPLYVGHGSADHVSHPELFQRGFVAGAPPDALSATGQLWGNPLYDWPALRRQGYRWWIERLRRALDAGRPLAHRPLPRLRRLLVGARARAKTRAPAAGGAGPAPRVFAAAAARARRAAADRRGPRRDHAGRRAPARRARPARDARAAVRLRRRAATTRTGRENHDELLVVYTGTHDTDTARRLVERARPRGRSAATGLDPAEPHWSLIELALASRAALAIVPAQDVLGLGSEARMNRPGTPTGNWSWRLEDGALTAALASRLRAATERAGALALSQRRYRRGRPAPGLEHDAGADR